MNAKPEVLARAHPSQRVGMTLEERIAWRREMLYRCVRELLLELQVLSSMYKFRLMNLDSRHHRFAIMMDVTQGFQPRSGATPLDHAAIEEAIRRQCASRYGIGLEAIYWRVNPNEASFARKVRAGDVPGKVPDREVVGDVRAASRRLSRAPLDAVVREEQRAFEEALRRGQRPPPITVGDRTYESDLAPLEVGDILYGTHFGKL